MTEQMIISRLYFMPESLKQEVLNYIVYLLSKYNTEKVESRTPKFGSAKGKYILSDDFDEPLECFKEYTK